MIESSSPPGISTTPRGATKVLVQMSRRSRLWLALATVALFWSVLMTIMCSPLLLSGLLVPMENQSIETSHSVEQRALMLTDAETRKRWNMLMGQEFKPQELPIPCEEFERIKIIRRLGNGLRKTADEGRYNGVDVVVKRLQEERYGTTTELETAKGYSLNEAVALYQLRNASNVMRMIGWCNYTMVVSGVVNTTLIDLIRKKEIASTHRKLEVSLDVARSIQQVHEHRFIHNDIKPRHFLINKDGKVLLDDFDQVRIPTIGDDEIYFLAFSVNAYRPPEELVGKPKDLSSDIYALSLVLWSLWAESETPYPDWDEEKSKAVGLGKLRPNLDELKDCPEPLQRVLVQAWDHDPSRRPTASQIVQQLEALVEVANQSIETSHSVDQRAVKLTDAERRKRWNMLMGQEFNPQELPIPCEEFKRIKIIRRLGNGLRKTADEGRYNGVDVVVKGLIEKNRTIAELKTARRYSSKEAAVLYQLRNASNVMRMIGWCNYTMVVSGVVNTTLLDLIIQEGATSTHRKLEISLDVARSIQQVHEHRFIHNDIKPNHFLINKEGKVLLDDFDQVRIPTIGADAIEFLAFSINPYRPPEELVGKPKDLSSDIYALSLVLWSLWAESETPYPDWDEEKSKAVGLGKLRPNLAELKDCPKPLQRVLVQAWDHDPSRRPTASQIVQQLEALVELSSRRVAQVTERL